MSVYLIHVLDQHEEDVQKIGERYDLCDPAGMCGFLSLALVHHNPPPPAASSSNPEVLLSCRRTLLHKLEHMVLPEFHRFRKAYIEEHPEEFCEQEGLSWSESKGRMSRSTFQRMVAGSAEIQIYLRSHTFSNPVYLLRPIVEGPVVSKASIRFPPPPGADTTTMELDHLFVEEERKYYNGTDDFYVGGTTDRCYSLTEWAREIFQTLQVKKEAEWVWVILDLHGHYCLARITTQHDDETNKKNDKKFVSTVYETVGSGTGVTTAPALLALMDSLQKLH